MKHQPNRNYSSDDVVQTPVALAERIVAHFRPTGRVLEPCAGEGNFVRALRAYSGGRLPVDDGRWMGDRGRGSVDSGRWTVDGRQGTRKSRRLPITDHGLPITGHRGSVDWCEIARGRDFFAWREPVDWIVTNPPWSQFRAFLQHGMRVADEVVLVPEYSPHLD